MEYCPLVKNTLYAAVHNGEEYYSALAIAEVFWYTDHEWAVRKYCKNIITLYEKLFIEKEDVLRLLDFSDLPSEVKLQNIWLTVSEDRSGTIYWITR